MAELNECLLDCIEPMQRRLRQNSSRYLGGAFDHLTKGLAGDSITDESLRRHARALGEVDLNSDLQPDPSVIRRESLQYPGFLAVNPLGKDIEQLASRCHWRHALIVFPRLGWGREGSEPQRVTTALLDLMGRSLLLRRPGETLGEPGGTHLILSLTQPELDRLPPSGWELLEQLLWVSSVDKKPGTDGDGGRQFLEAFAKASEEVLEIRREGRVPMLEFGDPKTLAALDVAYRVRSRLSGAGAGLPLSLVWALGFLGRHLEVEGLLSSKGIAEIFGISGRLTKAHAAALANFRTSREHAGLVAFARRIVEVVEDAGGPMNLRNIARCFKDQKQGRFLPVLEILVRNRVLKMQGERQYLRGNVDFEAGMLSKRESGNGSRTE